MQRQRDLEFNYTLCVYCGFNKPPGYCRLANRYSSVLGFGVTSRPSVSLCLRSVAHRLHHAALLPLHPLCGAAGLHPAVQPRHLLRRDGQEQRPPPALLRLAGSLPLLLLSTTLGGSGRREPHLAAPLPHDGRAGRAGRGHQHNTHPGAFSSRPF